MSSTVRTESVLTQSWTKLSARPCCISVAFAFEAFRTSEKPAALARRKAKTSVVQDPLPSREIAVEVGGGAPYVVRDNRPVGVTADNDTGDRCAAVANKRADAETARIKT